MHPSLTLSCEPERKGHPGPQQEVKPGQMWKWPGICMCSPAPPHTNLSAEGFPASAAGAQPLFHHWLTTQPHRPRDRRRLGWNTKTKVFVSKSWGEVLVTARCPKEKTDFSDFSGWVTNLRKKQAQNSENKNSQVGGSKIQDPDMLQYVFQSVPYKKLWDARRNRKLWLILTKKYARETLSVPICWVE